MVSGNRGPMGDKAEDSDNDYANAWQKLVRKYFVKEKVIQ